MSNTFADDWGDLPNAAVALAGFVPSVRTVTGATKEPLDTCYCLFLSSSTTAAWQCETGWLCSIRCKGRNGRNSLAPTLADFTNVVMDTHLRDLALSDSKNMVDEVQVSNRARALGLCGCRVSML